MRRTALGMMIALSALALGACGDDDDGGGGAGVSDEEQPYVDAIAAQFQTGDDSELQLTARQAQCVSPRWVDTIGVDRFEEHEVAPEDITDEAEDELPQLGLDEAEGNELYDAFEACDVDVPALFVQSLASDTDLGADVVSCLEGALDDELVRRLMVASITQGESALEEGSELEQTFTESIEGCAPETS